MEKEILPNTKTEPKEQAEQSAELILLDPEKVHFTRESSAIFRLRMTARPMKRSRLRALSRLKAAKPT